MALGHIISTISTKGGVGKSTSALLLLQELLERGHSVALLDLDPNKPFVKFRTHRTKQGRACPAKILGLGEFDDKKFFELIAELRDAYDFIILDCEGSQNFMLTKAASVTEIVIVPVNVSPLDSWSLPELTGFLLEQSQVMRRPLPYRVLLNFVAQGAVTPVWERDTIREIDEIPLPRFQTKLYEGRCFKDMWGYNSTLYELRQEEVSEKASPDRLRQIDRAIERGSQLCDELFRVMADSGQSAVKTEA